MLSALIVIVVLVVLVVLAERSIRRQQGSLMKRNADQNRAMRSAEAFSKWRPGGGF